MTAVTDFVRVLATNSTDASFPSRVPTTTEPTDPGVIDRTAFDGRYPDHALIVPFGTGSDNDTFNLRLTGWRRVFRDGMTTLWVPVLLAEVACTLGTSVGVSGAGVTNSERFVDSILITAGNADVSIEAVSPGGNVVAHLLIDAKGFAKLEITFDIASGATGMNALYATL